MDLKSIRKKQNRYRGLKAVSYLLGFPLLLLVVFVASVPFMNGDAFVDVKYYGIIACAAAWVVCILGQIIISLITKSNTGRTLFMLIITLILTVGATLFCDIYVSKQIEKINAQEEYVNAGVSVESYKNQAGWVVTWTNKESYTDKFNASIAHFCEIYNVEYKSKIYADYPKDEEGNDIKTNGYVNPDGSPVAYIKADDAYYSENGLYADGYVFGVKQALRVIIDYYEAKAAIEAAHPIFTATTSGDFVKRSDTGEYVRIMENGLYIDADDDSGRTLVKKLRDEGVVAGYYIFEGYENADDVLNRELAAMEADPNSAWNEYKTSEEYLDAYGENGTVYKFMFNETRLKNLVVALCSGIGTMPNLISTLNSVKSIIDVDSLLQENIGITVADIKNLTLEGLLDVLNVRMSDSLRAALTPTLEGFGITFPIQKSDVLNLVNSLFFYQSPTTTPEFMFLEDEDLVKYARAKYEGQTHGANVGSVLIPTESVSVSLYTEKISSADASAWLSDTYPTIQASVVLYKEQTDGSIDVVRQKETTVYSNVGKITMSDSGYPASYGYTLQQAYQLRADDSVAVPYYPLLVARRFLMVFSGVIAVTYVVFFYAKRRAREYADAIDNA